MRVSARARIVGWMLAVVGLALSIAIFATWTTLLARLDDPAKQWKFEISDVHGHEQYAATMTAYEDAIAATSTEAAPWFVVPAGHKWFARLCVAEILLDVLKALRPEPPPPPAEAALRAARMRLDDG